MTGFKIIETQETPYLYVERSCAMTPDEIGPAKGSAMQEVWTFMERHGVAPAGGALAVYYDYSPDQMTFRAGFIIARDGMAAADGTVKAAVTPAGRTVFGTHRGSYSGLRGIYGEMFNFVKAQGVDFSAPTWEVYLNSPEEVAEDQLITELYQALAG
jgi:effector-binding domain-containing protein